jgi:hypothetical protein
MRREWKIFEEKNKQVLAADKKWLYKLREVEEYIKENGKIPSSKDKDTEIKSLGSWVTTQKKNYKNNKYIMRNNEMRREWMIFEEKNKQVLLSHYEKWYETKNKIEEYIQKYNKLPSGTKDKDISLLASWVYTQKKNYKSKKQIMEKEDIRKEWCDLKPKYPHLF